jgi:hypothetical protein
MDWIAIGTAGVCGAIGGALGGLAGTPIKSTNLRSIIVVAVAIGAGTVGRILVTPYAEVEYLIRTPDLQPLVRLAPDHVDELKARLREAYQNGGTQADYERAGFLWGRKYAGGHLTDLFASKNGALAARSFDLYMQVFRAAYMHDRVACYDWIEGITTSPDELGFGPTEKDELQKLLNDAALASKPENGPVNGGKLDPLLQQTVIDRVRNNWSASDLDFDGLQKPGKDFPAQRKSKVCYTAFALYSEIQRLPMSDRLRFLRSMFGHA